MTPEVALAAAAFAALLGLPLFRRPRDTPPKPAATPAPAPAPAPGPAVAPVTQVPKPVPPTEPLVLKAFILNRKAELVGELAAEDHVVDVAYDGVLKLLEGKGLAKTSRLESPPYILHILQDGTYFMIAFTRSHDEAAVRHEAKALFQDTVHDLA